MKIQLSIIVFCIALVLGVFLFLPGAQSTNTDIVITEIGAYEASGHEWLEIYNKGPDPVDLSGWKFWEADTNHGLNLVQGDDTILNPGEYVVITQNDVNFIANYPEINTTIFDSSWGSLNESGEEIGLKDSAGDFVEQFTYVSAPNFSLERKDPELQDYSENNWLEHPDSNTVGAQNYWHLWEPPANKPPTAIINAPTSTEVNTEVAFDGNSSTDDDGSIVSYDWDFGDTSTGSGEIALHTYATTGTFFISLNIMDDGGATSTAMTSIDIIDIPEEPEPEPTPVPTSTPTIVIKINEFVSNPAEGENEWIELYNSSTSSIDLTGWTLEDGVGQIASPTSTIEALGFVVMQLNSSKLNNGGDIIILKNDSGEIVDQVSYGTWDDGNISDNANAPDKGNSSARTVDGQDTNVDLSDFAQTITSTKGLANSITPPEEPEEPQDSPLDGGGGGGGSSGDSSTPTPSYNAGDVVINELVSDPSDGNEEFVELFNTTNLTISLENWSLEDGSESKTSLTGSINPSGFFVIEKPKGNLNNSGDIVILYDGTGKEIDKVTYGNWDDGNLSDNAPAPEDPLSLARKVDGQDGDNDYYDFVLTSTITKKAKNVISSISEDGTITQQIIQSFGVVINEIFPNPEGSDNEEEFIELKNIGDATIDLSGWKLGDASTKRYSITQGSVKPGGFIVFKRQQTGIALNNTGGDEVKLFSSNGALVDSIKYTGKAQEDQSYAKSDDNNWAWTTEITPWKENTIKGKSAAPIIAIDADTEIVAGEPIIFDASDTVDPNNKEVRFIWDFDDGESGEGNVVKHRFKKEGIYTITLTAQNTSGEESKKSIIVTVKNIHDSAEISDISPAVEHVKISELIPNPEGSDTTEFIEFYNPTDEDIDLSNLKIDDEEGGSHAYTIPEGTTITAKGYLVFGKQQTKLALNNTADAVRFVYPDGSIIQEIHYDDVPEGASYIQDKTQENEAWVWTSTPTPGEENIITVPKQVAGTKITSAKKSKYIAPTIETTIERLRLEDIGDMVKVKGVVAVEPGVLGSQFFYIVQETASTSTLPGVQVYMYKKDFPDLDVGDLIEVTGELAETGGETRIKTKAKTDIEVLKYAGEPVPIPVELAAVGEPFEGSFILASGEVTELKGSHMYIDDGSEELKVYFKNGTGINKKLIALGDLVRVTGIVNQTKTGYQLLPRQQSDIVKTGISEDMIQKVEQLEKDESAEVAEKYLTATAGGLTSVLIGLFMKDRMGVVGRGLRRFWLLILGLFKKKKE